MRVGLAYLPTRQHLVPVTARSISPRAESAGGTHEDTPGRAVRLAPGPSPQDQATQRSAMVRMYRSSTQRSWLSNAPRYLDRQSRPRCWPGSDRRDIVEEPSCRGRKWPGETRATGFSPPPNSRTPDSRFNRVLTCVGFSPASGSQRLGIPTARFLLSSVLPGRGWLRLCLSGECPTETPARPPPRTPVTVARVVGGTSAYLRTHASVRAPPRRSCSTCGHPLRKCP